MNGQAKPFQTNAVREALASLGGSSSPLVPSNHGFGKGPPKAAEQPALQHEPGGDVITGQIKHPAFVTVERLFRKLPHEAIFDPLLSPSKPYAFELGSFQVPKGMQLWLTDYRFSILRFSGLDSGDFVEAEPTRFSSSVGFDITISSTIRQSNLAYQLDPTPTAVTRSQFNPPIPVANTPGRFEVPDSVFNNAGAQSFASTSGSGSSLLPVRAQKQGPRDGPFTFVIEEGQRVALSCSVLRQIKSPIAAFQGSLAGFTIHTNMGRALIARIRPQ